jgi:uncharacterized membrane protein
MNELPAFWRTEIFHPLSVHLPLVMLAFATAVYLFGVFSKKYHWLEMSKVLLLVGTAGAWISVYTGNLANSVVARKICDPTVLENHENAALMVAVFFTIASLMLILDVIGVLKKVHKLTAVVIIISMLLGTGFLVYTGHLGAKLVYQQAAGVYTPSDDCSEFE